MELDLSLDALKFANVSDFSRAYGDKVLSNGGSLTTKQFNEDVAKIFDTQRPIEVTEDSETGDIEFNANIVMNAATAITLTLGDGGFVGCKVKVSNISSVAHSVIFGEITFDIPVNKGIDLLWNGAIWNYDNNVIDDSKTDVAHTWSSQKVSDEIYKNNFGSIVDLKSYNSGDNMYTFPCDGYVSLEVNNNEGTNIGRLYVYSKTGTVYIRFGDYCHIGYQTNGSSLYVKKGMRCYVDGTPYRAFFAPLV